MKDLRKFIATIIREFINESADKSITLYHKVGGRQIFDMEERVKMVIKYGLKPYDAIGGDYSERGNIIWFSSDYVQYGEKSEFVLSIEYNEENANKYDMRFDGQYCSVFKEIPFNELTVVKIPIILMNDNRVLSNDFLIQIINNGKSSKELSKLINERKYKIFIDLFEKYVQPNISDINYTLTLKKSIDSTFIIKVK